MGTEKCATTAGHIPIWDAARLQLNYCMILSWFNRSQQLCTTQPLANSPRIRMGERIRRVKVRKLVG